jgi:hypothetical protein
MASPVPLASTFLARYPEFNGAPLALIEACLTDAAYTTHPNVYPTEQVNQQAVMLKAAILLCESPDARKIRLAEDMPSRYQRRLGLRVF